MTTSDEPAYDDLSPQARRLYTALGQHPGPRFSAALAAAITHTSRHEAEQLLAEHSQAGLITPAAQPGRWAGASPAIAAHAHTQAHAAGPGPARDLLHDILNWHLHTAVTCDLAIIPGRWHLGAAYAHAEPAQRSAAEALQHLDHELPNMLAATDTAAAEGIHELAWQIPEAMWGLLLYRRPYAEWIHLHETGLQAAQACADTRAEARMRIALGVALLDYKHTAEAGAHYRKALALAEADEHRIGEATAHDHLAQLHQADNRHEAAISAWKLARAIHIELDRPRGAALMRRHIGQAELKAGRPERAIATLVEAVRETISLPEPDPYLLARARTGLAEAYLATGRAHRARPLLDQALDTMTTRGALYQQAVIHRLYAAAQPPEQGRRHLQTALAILNELAHPDHTEVQALLAP